MLVNFNLLIKPAKLNLSVTLIFTLLSLFLESFSAAAYAEETYAYQFNTSFLQGSNQNPKALRSASGIIAGRYFAMITVNNKSMGRHELVISSEEENADKFCLSPTFFNGLSIKITQQAYSQILTEQQCIDLSLIDFATVEFDLSAPSLNITIPQRYIDQSAVINESVHGINGLKLGYNFNTSFDSLGYQSGFGSFNAQLNLFDWVTHADFSSRWSKSSSIEHNLSNLYATRPLTSINADVVIGKGYTSGYFVDGVSFGGIGLTSNRLMSDSTASFIPDISGIANSNSRITIRQHGRIVYSEVVAPGPYKITNFTVYGSGDLEVEIEDINGNVENKIYPLVSMPSLLREEYFDYSVAVGKRHQEAGIAHLFDSDRNFLFAEGRYGFSSFTAGLGMILDEKYQNLGFGSTLYLGSYGSLSLKGGISSAEYDNGEHLTGLTFGTEYAYQFSEKIHLQLAAYRYRDKDYVTYSSFYPEQSDSARQQQKHRFQTVVSSKLGKVNFNLMGWQQTYWNVDRSDLGASLSMSSTLWGRVGSNLSVGYSDNNGHHDVSSNLMFSLPLNFDKNFHYVSTSASVSTNSDFAMTASVNGQVNNRLSYSANVGDYGLSSNLSYMHDNSQFNASVNYYDGYSSFSLGASGAMVWTQPSGLLFSRSNNDTIAIIDTNGLDDVRVNGALTNSNGFGLVNLRPYQENSLSTDVGSVPIWAEMDTSSHNVKPVEGAILHHVVKNRKIYRFTLLIQDTQGQKLDSGDVAYQEYYLGSIAPTGMITIALQDKPVQLVSVQQKNGQCHVNLSAIEPNLSKIFEVICE
ncbi:fimbria/pilus outer membrane usher protein [Vibrio sp. TH_r3]|uniref:fimbria/pilus outer membrane usher protein n=1 Tax=Vibrio sp. TH_r3 TaxID=3082084 RepID=UPI0029556AFE|nr:fimbria/pilus outer membrane usher protein [Vibrio sp. TH_r3]MDV7105860.1 fimbria/pilus outer membrane usher protein [Vibrio sp. TH_r3]